MPLDEGGTLLVRTWNTPPAPEGAQPDTTFSLPVLSFSGFLSSLRSTFVSGALGRKGHMPLFTLESFSPFRAKRLKMAGIHNRWKGA